jgi:hypothetical protein
VLTPRGEWRTPVLFGVLDDHSRLVCHLQWYLSDYADFRILPIQRRRSAQKAAIAAAESA